MRNLKILGLALVALTAMTAVMASAAQAQNGRVTSTGPVKLTATNNPAPAVNALTSTLGNVECAAAKYTGTKVGSLTELLASGSESSTITPHYGTCSALGGFPATVDMNGCDYIFDLKGTIKENEYTVTTTFECSGAARPQVTVFTGASHAIRACTITVSPATDLTGLRAINTPGKGDFDIVGTIEGLHVLESSEFGCTKPGGTDANGIIHIDVTVECKNAAGVKTDCSLSHT